MPVSNATIIRNALGHLGLVGVGEPVEPEHASEALSALNALMADWKQDGVDLQYYEQTMADLGSPCPIPDHAQLAVEHYLAIARAPRYGKSVSAEFSALASQYYGRLTRDAVKERMQPARMDHLPQGEATHAGFDIERGY